MIRLIGIVFLIISPLFAADIIQHYYDIELENYYADSTDDQKKPYVTTPHQTSYIMNRTDAAKHHFLNTILRKKIYDVRTIAYSRAFSDKYKYPKRHIAPDLVPGVQLIEFRLFTSKTAEDSYQVTIIMDKDMDVYLPSRSFSGMSASDYIIKAATNNTAPYKKLISLRSYDAETGQYVSVPKYYTQSVKAKTFAFDNAKYKDYNMIIFRGRLDDFQAMIFTKSPSYFIPKTATLPKERYKRFDPTLYKVIPLPKTMQARVKRLLDQYTYRMKTSDDMVFNITGQHIRNRYEQLVNDKSLKPLPGLKRLDSFETIKFKRVKAMWKTRPDYPVVHRYYDIYPKSLYEKNTQYKTLMPYIGTPHQTSYTVNDFGPESREADGSSYANRHVIKNLIVRKKIYDIRCIVYSREFAKKYQYPEQYIADDLDPTVHLIEFRFFTDKSADESFQVNVLLNKGLNLDMPNRYFRNSMVVAYPSKTVYRFDYADKGQYDGGLDGTNAMGYWIRDENAKKAGDKSWLKYSIDTSYNSYNVDREQYVKKYNTRSTSTNLQVYDPTRYRDYDYLAFRNWIGGGADYILPNSMVIFVPKKIDASDVKSDKDKYHMIPMPEKIQAFINRFYDQYTYMIDEENILYIVDLETRYNQLKVD